MKRFTPEKDGNAFELTIIGGGIYGAAMAYCAAKNNINVLIIEKNDFASGASANSQKVIHGGLRYLQNLDLKRVWESIKEQQRFYTLFPHLVEPLECVLPTTKWTLKSNLTFQVAFIVYNFLKKLLNNNTLHYLKGKRPKILSKDKTLALFPHLKDHNIQGGALWYDALCKEPERVIITLLQEAYKNGAKVANYSELQSISRKNSNQVNLNVSDRLKDKKLIIQTDKVALCTGAQCKEDYTLGTLPQKLHELSYILGFNLITSNLFQNNTSLAAKTVTSGTSKLLFIVPWKNYSITGTHWQPHHDSTINKQDFLKKNIHDIKEFQEAIQQSLHSQEPLPDLLSAHAGIVPGIHNPKADAGAANILPHYRLVDREKPKQGDVVQVVGVKFTTSFDVILKALKTLFKNKNIQQVNYIDQPIANNHKNTPAKTLENLTATYSHILEKDLISLLFQMVGHNSSYVIETYLKHDKNCISEDFFYKGLTNYCIQEEMVIHLNDLIRRRLFPDLPKLPDDSILTIIAETMATQLSWNKERLKEEIDSIKDSLINKKR